MRGAFRSEPKSLAIFPSQTRNPWRLLPIRTRGVVWSGPKFLAVFTNLNARRSSARTTFLAIFPNLNARRLSVRPRTPGNFKQFKCEAFFGKDQNSWRYFPIRMRGVCRSEPEYLTVSSSLNAKCFSGRTKNPSHVSQFARDVLFGQNQISRWRFPI